MRTAALILLYGIACGFGTYLVFRPTFDSGFAAVQADRGDSLLNHYILEHSWLALTDSNYRGSLVSPPMFYPASWTLYYSETLFGVAPLYWALRITLPYDLAFAWWQIILSVTNFVAFAVVARWLKWPHLIAIGGAFLWAFAMVHADQIKHQQLICRLWMPFAVYYAIALLTEPSLKTLHRLCACVVLQTLACIYTGWFLVAGLGVFVPLLAALRPGTFTKLKQFVRENKRTVRRACILWVLAMLATVGPYAVVNLGIGRYYSDCQMPTPSAWFTGPPDSMWSATTAAYREPVTPENRLFCGFTIYALMFAAGVSFFVARYFGRGGEHPLETAVIGAATGTVIAWVLFTLARHEKGDSLWWVARLVPGGIAIRVVTRVYLIVYLFGSIAALTWFAQLTARIQRPWLRYAIQALVMGAMMFEQTQYEQQRFERKDFYPLVDEMANKLKGAEVGYVVPAYTDPNGVWLAGPEGEVFGMWVGLRANVPVLNGYSGRAPHAFPPWGTLDDAKIRGWLSGKYRGRVRIIDPDAPPDKQVREIVVE